MDNATPIPPAAPNPSPPRAPPPKNAGLAVASLTMGIVACVASFCCMGAGLLVAIPAVICGHLALSRIARSGEAIGGRGQAMAGLITGYVGLALSLIAIPIMASIAVPSFVQARARAQEALCQSNRASIQAAKVQWAAENPGKAENEPTMEDLSPYLGEKAGNRACPTGGTYTIGSPAEEVECTIHATDAEPTSTGGT
jgi:hypothetical protein